MNNYPIHAKNEQHTPVVMVAALEYLNAIDFVGTMNRALRWDEKQCKLTPGHLALSVVLSTFAQIRSPLYHIQKNFMGMDTELLFGSGVTAECLTDDSIGRTLDKIYAANSSGIFSSLALNAYSAFDLSFTQLHSDTTSISLYGDYQACNAPNYTGLDITEGYSKDHRPDLKQIMVGTVTNEQGIVLYQKTIDGNTSDCVWNQETVQSLQNLLGDKLKDTIYIADSKAVTLPNLLLFSQSNNRMLFLSRCPDNFYRKLAEKVKQRAYESNHWTDIGRIKEDKLHASYESQAFEEIIRIVDKDNNIYDIPVQLFVYRSSDSKNRVEKRLQKEQERLTEAKELLEKKRFACQEDAESAAQEFCQSKYRDLIDVKTAVQSTTIHTPGRGRQGKVPRPLTAKTTWHVES